MHPPDAEVARLSALHRYGSMDRPGEDELAGIVRVAATVAGVPSATLNLLDDAVQHNYVTHGFVAGSCPREESMCVVALRQLSPLHVPDASVDSRFVHNPWVDGRLGSIRLYASSPLVTPDGWMIGTLCVFDDQPGRLAPEVLRALDDLAAQAMALLERRRLVRMAEDALRAKSDFLATVSHEIRTPMHGVLGLLELVLQEQLPDAARAHGELAQRSASSLLRLVDDVLDLAKGDAGRVELRPRPFDPAALVGDVGDALRVLARRKRLGLLTRVEGTHEGLVLGDPDRVRQVLVNLVGNAIKFSAAGDVEVVLHADAAAAGEVDLRLTVRDSGEGIPAEELPTLFTPFAQGRSGRRHGGTGLGLAICAQIVEGMGGSLDVASVHGAGSTFTFCVRLPAVAAAAAPTALDTSSCAGLRVLVADDNEVNRLIAVALLQALGVSAQAVDGGIDAVAEVSRGCYDVVLLDHEMPDMDGPTAARLIRDLPGDLGRLPVWALTGRVGDDDVQRCLAAGMDGVLPKPLHVPALVAALSSGRPA